MSCSGIAFPMRTLINQNFSYLETIKLPLGQSFTGQKPQHSAHLCLSQLKHTHTQSTILILIEITTLIKVAFPICYL